MKIVYEVHLGPTRKFAAAADDALQQVTIGEYYNSPEGWIAGQGEIVISCREDADIADVEMKQAIRLAFEHLASKED